MKTKQQASREAHPTRREIETPIAETGWGQVSDVAHALMFARDTLAKAVADGEVLARASSLVTQVATTLVVGRKGKVRKTSSMS